MPSAGKICVKKSIDNVECKGRLNLASRKYENISVIVLASQLRQFHFPADCSAYALMFIESHGYAVACAANADSGIAFAIDNSLGTGMCIIGIVAAFG